MSYLSKEQVQSWLNDDKYPLVTVNENYETTAVAVVLGKLSQRYDTSVWTDGVTTPKLVVSIISMLVAAYEMRQVASEEDGRTSHAEWLEKRAMELTTDIVDGCIDLPGVDTDPGSDLGGGPLFWPTDASTALAEECSWDPLASPKVFRVGMEF